MSKPNLLSFKVSIGIHGNKRISEAKDALLKAYPAVMVPWATHAKDFFEMIMGYAAENQVNGDFKGYTNQQFYELVFGPKCLPMGIPMSLEMATDIVRVFRSVGLLDKDKIRSWLKFNGTLATHEKTSKQNREAGKISAEKRRLKDKAEVSDLKGKKNGNGAAEEYGIDTQPVPASKDGRIDWDGKAYFPSELEKVVQSLEVEVEKKSKQCKKSAQEMDDSQSDPNRYASAERSHNVCFDQLLALDKQLASAKSALLGTPIEPPTRRKPKPAPAPPRRGAVRTEDPEAADKALKDFSRLKETLAVK